jgi:aspartate oxidase
MLDIYVSAPPNTYFTKQNAANYVSESIQGTGAEASKETNKHVAKDSDAKLSTRASAAKDALVDKKDEKSHETKADLNKGKSNP